MMNLASRNAGDHAMCPHVTHRQSSSPGHGLTVSQPQPHNPTAIISQSQPHAMHTHKLGSAPGAGRSAAASAVRTSSSVTKCG